MMIFPNIKTNQLFLSIATFFLLSTCIKAADVEFTITNETPSGNNGSILIDINFNITNPPFTVTIEGENNYYDQFSTSDYIFEISNLSRGEYCITIEKDDGCSISECLTVKRCMTFHGLVLCLESPKVPTKGVFFLLANNTDLDGVLDTNSQFEYKIVSPLEYEDIEPILTQVFIKTEDETQKIITTNSSDYLIEEQNEIFSNDEFIFKFFTNGSLDWIVQTGIEKPVNSKEKSINNITPLPIPSSKISSVFPNPFKSEIDLSLDYISDGVVTIQLINSIGVNMESSKFQVSKGKNFISIPNLEGLRSGLYELLIFDKSGFISSHKVLKIK